MEFSKKWYYPQNNFYKILQQCKYTKKDFNFPNFPC